MPEIDRPTARESVTLSTDQVRVMFTGTHPQFYRPDQAQRAEQFDRWLEMVRAEGVQEGRRQAVADVRSEAVLSGYEYAGLPVYTGLAEFVLRQIETGRD